MSRFGATILDADGLRLSAEEKAFFRDANPFGFILFARNIETPDQVYGLCSEFREAVGRDAPITIDQEGGRVQRLRAPIWREWSPPMDFVHSAGEHAPRAMYLRYRLIADELRRSGIDSNCAPLVDIATEDTHPFLQNRCYGYDAETVARLGRAAADGHLDGGVLPVVKHMPGHGRATSDSHYDLPSVNSEAAVLQESDFAPFRALNDLPMGMTAHLALTSIDGDIPATLSSTIMQMIRDEIGFVGLIMTDDIGMKALVGSPGEVAQASIAAGCDVVLQCNAPLADRIAVAEAVGEMTDDAQRRAEAALAQRREPDDVDIASLTAELEALMGGQGHGG